MSQPLSSKEAAAYLIDPMTEPEPSAVSGPGTHFGSTFAPAKPSSPSSMASNNPFRDSTNTQAPLPSKSASTHVRQASLPDKSGPTATARETTRFPGYREEAFGGIDPFRRPSGDQPRSGDLSRGLPAYSSSDANYASASAGGSRRRTSSLKERFPGDTSNQPLEVARRESKKANRSPHLRKTHIPGADMVDRLDPAIGGRAYHHEGPYDAALLARNLDVKSSPVAAVAETNAEALKATPQENIKDALDRHQPLDGVAVIAPGVPDQFGRTYNYKEGADLMREGTSDAGYRRWPGKEYDEEDLDGKAEPAFSLDRALKAHKIDDNGIEMEDRAHINKDYHRAERKGTLDTRDPVEIAGGESKYDELLHANDTDLYGNSQVKRSGSLRDGLKRRIGSLRHRKD